MKCAAALSAEFFNDNLKAPFEKEKMTHPGKKMFESPLARPHDTVKDSDTSCRNALQSTLLNLDFRVFGSDNV